LNLTDTEKEDKTYRKQQNHHKKHLPVYFELFSLPRIFFFSLQNYSHWITGFSPYWIRWKKL